MVRIGSHSLQRDSHKIILAYFGEAMLEERFKAIQKPKDLDKTSEPRENEEVQIRMEVVDG